MKLTIKKLTRDLMSDYLHFFDNIAFCDNPSWSRCYCNHFHIIDPSAEEDFSKETSRNCVVDRINEGKHNGFMAFVGNEPVGWVNADVKENFARIMANDQIDYDDTKRVASVVCFVVSSQLRGQGVATSLLKEACDYFKENGYDAIEAYPVKSPKNEAENYHGPLKLYRNFGFEVTGDLDHIFVVTKNLR